MLRVLTISLWSFDICIEALIVYPIEIYPKLIKEGVALIKGSEKLTLMGSMTLFSVVLWSLFRFISKKSQTRSY